MNTPQVTLVTKTAIRAHHIETGHTIYFKGAKCKILDRADSDRKLQLKELLHIDKRKPILNKQQTHKQSSELM